jgi:hypothetical protein
MSRRDHEKSGLATAALVLGIIGVVLSFIPIINNAAFVLGGLALIFAIIALAKKRSVAVAIVSLVLAVAAMGITLAMQKAAGDALDAVSNSLNDASGDNTEDILKNDVQVDLGDFTVTTGDFGVQSSKLEVTVLNKLSDQHSYSIQIEAVGADGARIMDDTVYANNLGANQSQKFEAFTLATSDKYEVLKTATFKIVSVSKS